MEKLIKEVAEVCKHCGQELQRASSERKEILSTLETKIDEDINSLKGLLENNINVDANLHKRELKMDTELIERQEKLDAELTERQEKLDTDLTERQAKLDAELTARQEKIDAEAEEMLRIMKRIEESVGANVDVQVAIKQMEERIRSKIAVEDRRDMAVLKREAELKLIEEG